MLNKQDLAEQFRGKKIRFEFLFDRPDSQFRLTHATDWVVIASEDKAAVFRLMDQGELIAQCNVLQLPTRPADNPLKMSQFQEEVKRITAESNARIVDSEAFTSAAGHETYRVLVEGIESGIPFNWHYYHVAAADGRHATLVFTLEKESQEYLRLADRALVNGFVFKPMNNNSTAANNSQASGATR
jgi:hypothetical protein